MGRRKGGRKGDRKRGRKKELPDSNHRFIYGELLTPTMLQFSFWKL